MLSRPGCGGLSEEGGLGLRLGPAQLKMRSDEEIEAEAAAERLKQSFDERPHRRFNPLTRSWVLCSPHRAKRCTTKSLEFKFFLIDLRHFIDSF
jgi:hypothetical protein